ncbi:MAG: hypothetical protein MK198_09610 [Gracilimonas sp.]|uniref:hypothetical protein n=1 Tax=Gracilimonas sp. TaxID=1974203 RepID=UPI0037503DD9|nr:hypothetical protein [Gracilimonas sp.]
MVDLNDIKLLDVQPLSSSSKYQLFVISYQDRHFEVSESVAALIEILKVTNSEVEVALELSRKNGIEYSQEEIKKLVNTYIDPIFRPKSEKKDSYIWLKKEFLSSKSLSPLTHYFSYLFKPEVVIAFTVCIAIAQICFFVFATNGQSITSSHSIESFLLGGGLFFLSVIFHELGHASACKYYGIEHGHIGIGLYLHFPVFYADVSNIWKLRRKQRIVVDLAGIYFQLLFLLPIILVHFMTNLDLKYVIYAINLSFLFDLNPFFRFDGYWVFTDLLGIANLRQRTNEAISYMIKKMRGKEILEKPYLYKINAKEKYIFLGYIIVSNLFFGYYILYKIPLFLYQFVRTIPNDLQYIFESFTRLDTPFPFELLGPVLIQLGFILLILYMFFKVLSSIYNYTTNKLS